FGALEHLDLGMNHLPAAVTGLELTVENDSRSDFELVLEIADLMKPGERQNSSPVARLRLQDPPAAPARIRGADGDDLRCDRSLRSRNELRDRRQRAAVLVAKRQGVENVLDRGNSGPRELVRSLRSYALHELRRRREQGERRAEVAFRGSIDRGGRGPLPQALDLAQALRGAAVARLFGVERKIGDERAQPLERSPIRPAFFRRVVDQL